MKYEHIAYPHFLGGLVEVFMFLSGMICPGYYDTSTNMIYM